MIINMAGGGGGAALNFKVIPGLTQPGEASENTIWVNTERINNWYFSATQPEGMQEWDVWFQTDTSSAIEFNALKKNGIQVCPMFVKQYINNAWANIPAEIHQNGVWHKVWDGVILKPNDTNFEHTGGWVADTRLGIWDKGNTVPTVTHNSAGVDIKFKGDNARGCYRTAEKVAISGFNFLKVHFNDYGGERGVVAVAVTDKLDTGIEGNAAARWLEELQTYDNPVIMNKTITINTSGISGEYYIAIVLRQYDTTTDYISANISKVWFE